MPARPRPRAPQSLPARRLSRAQSRCNIISHMPPLRSGSTRTAVCLAGDFGGVRGLGPQPAIDTVAPCHGGIEVVVHVRTGQFMLKALAHSFTRSVC